MNCRQCGNAIADGATFCKFCGEKAMTESGTGNLQTQHTSGITSGADGVMRWVYEMNMWKNPTLLITVWKVLLLAALAPALLVFFLSLENGFFEAVGSFAKVGAIVVSIVTALMLLAYPVVTIINGGKYCVIFEMDEKGIRHIQMQKQFKKSQALAMIGVVAGALMGSPQAMGANLMAGSKQSLYCSFSKVKQIVINEKRHVIHVNEKMNHNQVYAAPEDFEFVQSYLLEHCKKARVVKKA